MATNTYVALDTVTVSGSSTNTIQFTGIPAGYTDLVLVSNTRSSDSRSGYQSVSYTFNSTGSSQYSGTVLYGNGSSALSYRQPNESVFEGLTIMNGSTSGIFYTNILNIMNYSNTNTYKTVLMEMGAAGLGAYKQAVTWRNTSAITTIEIKEPSNLAWVAGSSATLYGIATANAGVAKATGGTITYGGDGYIYHTFTSNGTFTPNQTLSCDYLVVAGGGGGGYQQGGGGGAGGYRIASSSLTATGYAVTIGAGGSGSGGGAGANGVDSSLASLLTSTGGGGGGGRSGSNGGNGGSGGGAGLDSSAGTGTSGQGYAGGAVNGNSGAGGGGASAAGTAAPSSSAGGSGGNGSTWYNGTTYAGGGGGGTFNGSSSGNQTNGGTGGGGGGGYGASNGATGTANTGGGGGGGGQYGGSLYNGAAGGSGVVIIRYLG